MMYQSANLYDALYAETKDYAKEVSRLHELITQHKTSSGRKLLDVACGTGQHLFFLKNHYEVEGLDINPDFIEISQKKLPQATIHKQNMMSFELPTKFDVITCLFSSIGYTKTYDCLASTLLNMRKHVKPGGLLIIEPWYTPSTFKPGHFTATIQEIDGGKVVRTNHWSQENGHSQGDSQFLVVNSSGIKHISEKHVLGLFSKESYTEALEAAGLKVVYDEHGLIGRGLYVGISPQT
ncbi:MAG: class I SAM-dependent methyltransferase [Cyanobacteria bacterium SZAS-4]|nr:class I SAM-dependent methyltransferase [Cyanobacteria bacterium SZAS-4]